VPQGEDYFSDLFRSRIAVALPGHDPTIQLLSPADLARAVRQSNDAKEGPRAFLEKRKPVWRGE